MNIHFSEAATMPKLSTFFFALAFGVPSIVSAATSSAGQPGATQEPSSPDAPTALQALQRHHKSLSKMVTAGAKRATLQSTVDPMIDYHWLAQATLGGSSRAMPTAAGAAWPGRPATSAMSFSLPGRSLTVTNGRIRE